jgi:serine O-acetyltransferase
MEKQKDTRIKDVVDLLLQSYQEHEGISKVDAGPQINRSAVIDIIDKLRCVIFPGYFGKKNITSGFVEYYAGNLLEDVVFNLSKQIAQALLHRSGPDSFEEGDLPARAEELTFAFLSQLPRVREYLATDVSAAFDGDPAAFSKDEIISSYPGVYAIMVYRLAHGLYEMDVPLIPRIMTEHAHNVTGIDIHPGASIGHHFFIDHGTGIVIGETTVIGSHVKLYQGVTLGGLSTRGGQGMKGLKRHPTIEDQVTIYSGASILGGNTIIGAGVVIGSNAFVTASVPKKTKVSVKNPELQYKTDEQNALKESQSFEFWDYVI